MNTPTITFSTRFKKMPAQVEYLRTYVTDVQEVKYIDLTMDEIKSDTETVDGSTFNLPRARLIRIKLWTETINGPVTWFTFRRHDPQKYDYYRGLRGSEVQIVIGKKEAPCVSAYRHIT